MRMNSMSIIHLYWSNPSRIIRIDRVDSKQRERKFMRNVYKSGLLVFLRGTACLAFLTVSALCGARADDVACEPAKLAAKYPSLAGRTIKVGQDGESVPFS